MRPDTVISSVLVRFARREHETVSPQVISEGQCQPHRVTCTNPGPTHQLPPQLGGFDSRIIKTTWPWTLDPRSS